MSIYTWLGAGHQALLASVVTTEVPPKSALLLLLLLAATGAPMGGMLDVELRVANPEADEYCEIIEESRRAETAARDLRRPCAPVDDLPASLPSPCSEERD